MGGEVWLVKYAIGEKSGFSVKSREACIDLGGAGSAVEIMGFAEGVVRRARRSVLSL